MDGAGGRLGDLVLREGLDDSRCFGSNVRNGNYLADHRDTAKGSE